MKTLSEKALLELPVVIAGTGGAAWWILEGFTREKIDVKAFIVSNPKYEAEDTCAGLPVWKYDTWKKLPLKQTEYLVVMGVMNPNVDVKAMKSELVKNGWRKIIDFDEYARLLLAVRSVNICMLDPGELRKHNDEISKLRSQLADSKSVATLDGFTYFIESLDEREFPEISEIPYFPKDIPRWQKELKFIDCGAYDGDTVKQAMDSGYLIKQAFCFEPDPISFRNLTLNLMDLENIFCLPLGVSDATAMKSFSSQQSTGSRLVDQGDSWIQCVAIDDFMNSSESNLIKMDIEGGELSALKGATKVLKRYRPNLAISVYHKTNDIWQIPSLIIETLGSCELYLRRHSRTIADTVLYVFPDN